MSHASRSAARAIVIGFIAVAVIAPLVVDPRELDVTTAGHPRLAAPSWATPLGTDEAGRSLLLLLLVGARFSVLLGTVTAVLAVVTGVAVGMAGALGGRWITFLLNRTTEWFLALPSLPLAIAVGVVLGGGLPTMVVAIALGMWPAVARLVRAQVLAVNARGYVERARALGAGGGYIARTHLLPGIAGVVLSAGVLLVSEAVLAAAALSFLGVHDGGLSWGGLLRRAVDAGAFSSGAWWYMTAPGCAIVALSLSIAVCGRQLEAAVRPGWW